MEFWINALKAIIFMKPRKKQREVTRPASPEHKVSNMKPAYDPSGTATNLTTNVEHLLLPHERDESTLTTANAPDPVILQAKRDLDAGMVDTDMRATPGLDAQKRSELVKGPGGKPPSSAQKNTS